MADPYMNDFMLEVGCNAMEFGNPLIKQETIVPDVLPPSSASVPIPGNHRGSRGGIYDQFSPSPLANTSVWFNRPDNLESSYKLEMIDALDSLDNYKMDDDDIFQVDKNDLIQGPTLAELNAHNDETLGELNFDDLLGTEENMQQQDIRPSMELLPGNTFMSNSNNTTNYPSQQNQLFRGCITNQFNQNFSGSIGVIDPADGVSSPTFSSPVPIASHIIDSSTASSSTSPHPVMKPLAQSTLHELLMKKGDIFQNSPAHSQMEMVFRPTNNAKISRLSMSAPTQTMGLEQLWLHREPRPHLLSTGSLGLGEAGSTSSLSTGGPLSPNPLGIIDQKDLLSHDEYYEDSDDDSDHYDDFSSDNGGSDNDEPGASKGDGKDSRSKREKYFWQYNVQAKGPKGQRLVTRQRLEDPHVLNEVTDPVFSPTCALRGIKHSGKARKGDGNDLTPNAAKLHSIGKELDKLSKVINDMTPVSELPFPVRPKTRKEKNKLASRACRLKKKAQHEANKIKLHGLEHEHKLLIHGIQQAKQILCAKVNDANQTNPEVQQELTRQMDRVYKNSTKIKIANHTTDYVNKVLDLIKAGVPDGGIDDF